MLADYLPYVLVINVPDPPPAVPICRDAFDLPFLHLTVSGRADVLVTGDTALLALAGAVDFAIMPPDVFLNTRAPDSV